MSESLAEEEKQRMRTELMAEIEKNEQDLEQCNEETGRYNREFLYNVRDLEKLCSITGCPLASHQLKEFGICPSLPRKFFAKLQAKIIKNEQDLEQCNEKTGQYSREFLYNVRDLLKVRQPKCPQKCELKEYGIWCNQALKPEKKTNRLGTNQSRVKRTRRDGPVVLHKAEHPWKLEKINDESDEGKIELLIRNVRALLNKITPTTEKSLTKEFLDYRVHESAALEEIITVIIDIVSEEHRFCELFSRLCEYQITSERKNTGTRSSAFQDALLTILAMDLDFEKQAVTNEREPIVPRKSTSMIGRHDLAHVTVLMKIIPAHELRSRKLGCAKFIGHLFVRRLVPIREFTDFSLFSLHSLFLAQCTPDEVSIECGLRMLATIGGRLHDVVCASDRAAATEDANSAHMRSIVRIDRMFWNVRSAEPLARNRNSDDVSPESVKFLSAYLWQTFPLFHGLFYELHRAKTIVSSRIRCLIINLEEQRANGWKSRRTEEEPMTLDQIRKVMERAKKANHSPTTNSTPAENCRRQ